ncbi:MAG TPA: dihydropteroate synthase, partial [Marmoricola sp.]|nr:dihydropteroate synthase [Marmoricola sp.]
MTPVLMGVVNVTPDSFSDGGRFVAADAAIAQGLLLRDQGADLVDVGGESTRPGATRPLLAEELSRVIPVIDALVAAGVRVSVDTMRHEVAAAALASGASLINDVSGGLADPDILQVVADHEAPFVAMHWR